MITFRGYRRRLVPAAAWIGLIVLLGWLVWPAAKLVLLHLLPLVVFIVGVTFLPVRMAPAVRMAVSLGVFLIFLFVRKFVIGSDVLRALVILNVGISPPFELLETLALVIALLWLAGQMLIVVVSDRVRSGVARPIEIMLSEHGYAALRRAVDRGEFGVPLARWTAGVRWSAVILVCTMLLYRSHTLHWFEESVLLRPTPAMTMPGPSHSVIVTLTTPDNNPRQYLRTALEIDALFRAGGAVVVCFPARGSLDSTAAVLRDSLERNGAIVFDREQFDAMHAMMGRTWELLRFHSIALSWTDGSPVVHPALLAAARYLRVPVQIPASHRRYATSARWTMRSEGIVDNDVKLGGMSIPRWDDGYSVVPWREGFQPASYPTRVAVQWNSFIFPANIERPSWEEPLIYKIFGSSGSVTALPDSLWRVVDGRMVFVQWVDMGESAFQGTASLPAMAADMASRGSFVRESGAWQLAVSCLVALCAVMLFVWARPSVQCALLLMLAVAIAALDVWIFREHLLIARMIYPAFVAGVAGIVLPLVRMSRQD